MADEPTHRWVTLGARSMGGNRRGTAGLCSCGWRYKTNESPSAGGLKMADKAFIAHAEEARRG